MGDRTGVRLLAAIVGIGALYLGRGLFVPVTFGIILSAVLYPIVDGLRRLRMPVSLGAALAVLLALAVLIVAAALLEPPIRRTASEIPKTLMTARARLQKLGIPLPGAGDSWGSPDSTTKQHGAAPDLGPQRPGADGGIPAPPGITQAIETAFGVTASVLFPLVEILLLAFFILAAGTAWKDKLRRAIKSPERYQRVLDTTYSIRHVVLRYLLVNVIINATQGVLVGLVVWALGYPSPLLWGVSTFIAEFVPYFGGATMVVLLLLTGYAAGGGLGRALIAPAAYLLISTLQNDLVSPVAYGQSLRLNPTALLVGVLFWGLVWGIPGVFLAVPLLAAMRIIAEQTESLAPAAIFVEE